MQFPNGTRLIRKEPLPDVEVEVGLHEKTSKPVFKKHPHPLNAVEVLMPSPIASSDGNPEQWSGLGGSQSIVAPMAAFGANEIMPDAYLQKFYTVTRMGQQFPDPVAADPNLLLKRQQLMRSPEDVFAQAAAEQEGIDAAAGETE